MFFECVEKIGKPMQENRSFSEMITKAVPAALRMILRLYLR